ncbi:hypothetical protein ABE438_00805 [Bosea sp. TWI1241]|uniref:hypothetical protein n=1 Tax=Bosea sp. TWI1241 TaxID=3148904 RepID=UPI003209C9AA
MRSAHALAAGMLAALAAPASAETYLSVAAATDAYRTELAKSCSEVGSTLDVRPGFVREVDLNGDGVPDAILSTRYADCATAPAPFAFSGSSGEAARWVVSVPGGFETLEFVYQKVEIERSGGAPRITLSLPGGICGLGALDRCRHVIQLDGSRVVASAWSDGQARPEPTKATASPAASDPVPVMTADHNGSVMEIRDDRILYAEPKASLRGVVKPGTVLVEGKWTGDRFAGTAYAFKKGCPPASYAVSGAKVERPGQLDLVLRGAGPIRKGCEVVGYSDRSPHARLVFEKIMSE